MSDTSLCVREAGGKNSYTTRLSTHHMLSGNVVYKHIQWYMWQKSNIVLLRISSASLSLTHYIAKLPLRVGLICTM